MSDDTSKQDGESLEEPETKPITSPDKDEKQGDSLDGGNEAKTEVTTTAPAAKKNVNSRVRGLITHINVYLLLFVSIVVLSAGTVFIAFQRNKKATTPTTIATQPLTTETLSQLKDSEAKVGDPKQTLTIESNAIFSGKVLIRDSLDVAGTIKVGGTLSLTGINVSGAGTFDQVQTNTLTVANNATIQGQLNVQKNIVSTAGATFGGPVSVPQLSVQSFQLSGDLQITRHIDAGGGTPGKTDGTALGNGGTSSVSGTDTAGTITINTGSSPIAGCFATIIFSQKFGGTPHVVITPVGSAAAGLSYYVNRNTSNFSVCSTNPAPAGQSFSFDYIVID